MEPLTHVMEMLNLMMHPAFCVHHGVILGVNPEAQQCMLSQGMAVADILTTGKEEYTAFSSGCLYLTVRVCQQNWGASVTRVDGLDIFVLEQDQDQAQLRSLALAAQELREPLSSVMTVTDRLFPALDAADSPELQSQMARINRGLFHLLRLVSNMSDASRYNQETAGRMETREIASFLEERFRHCAELVQQVGINLQYTGLSESIYCLIDPEKLERSIHNLLSNAIKFTPQGGTVQISAAVRGTKLYLQIRDNGCGIPDELRSSVFSRYLRSPGVEDGRYGIGLGMVLVRSTAALHGGTVLVEQPEDGGTRVTMTLQIRQDRSGTLRSNVLKVDYAGERDHGLVEFSDTLPYALYTQETVN